MPMGGTMYIDDDAVHQWSTFAIQSLLRKCGSPFLWVAAVPTNVPQRDVDCDAGTRTVMRVPFGETHGR